MGELIFSRITGKLLPFSGSPAFLSGVDTSFFGEEASLCVSSVPLLFCAEKNYKLNETKGIFDHGDQNVSSHYCAFQLHANPEL